MNNRALTSIYATGALICAFGIACNSPDIGPSGTVQTKLQGGLSFDLKGVERAVEVYSFEDGQKGQRLCESTSDRDGTFSCELGPVGGDLLVEVSRVNTAPLQRVILGVKDQSTTWVNVNVFTHLQAAHIQAQLKEGFGLAEAMSRSGRLLWGHLGGVSFDEVVPFDLAESEGRGVLSDDLIGALLIEALSEQGRLIEQTQGLPPGRVTAQSFISVLASDLSADGLFDGKARFGELSIQGYELTPATFRTDFARALLSYVSSQRNRTGLQPEDVQGLAQAIAGNTSQLFPADSMPPNLDAQGPTVLRFEAVGAGDQPLSTEVPRSGQFWVLIESEDESGIGAVEMSLEGFQSAVTGPLGGSLSAARFSVDATRIDDGMHVLRARLIDGVGNETVRDLLFSVDATAPVLTVQAAGVVSEPIVTVTGTVAGELSPVSVEVRQGGQLLGELNEVTGGFSIEVNLDCSEGAPVVVRAEDIAQNVAEEQVLVVCDGASPSITRLPSDYLPEDQLDVQYLGGQLRYVQPQSGMRSRLDVPGVLSLVKYYTRLDAGSDNPVTFFFLIEDETLTEVSYRYLRSNVVQRDWSPLSGTPEGVYTADVSYQSLSAALIEGGPVAVHRLEVRAQDAAGRQSIEVIEFVLDVLSPPLFVTSCALDAGLSSYTLRDQTLDQLYQQSSASVLSMDFVYPVQLPANSMAPDGGLDVQVQGGDVQSRITSVHADKHLGQPEPILPDLSNWCPADYHRLIDPVTSFLLPCQAGLYLSGAEVLSEAVDGPLHAPSSHSLGQLLSRAGQPVPVGAQGQYSVVSGQAHQLEVLVLSPEFSLDGQSYGFSEALVVPPGFVPSAGPRRYRLNNFESMRGFEYRADALGQIGARWFITAPFIGGFAVSVTPPELSATHQSLPAFIEVPVIYDPACESALSYVTSL